MAMGREKGVRYILCAARSGPLPAKLPDPFFSPWVFTGICLTNEGRPYRVNLMHAADVRIVYHVLIRHAANPYDPAWEPYHEDRLQKKMAASLMGRNRLKALCNRQGGRCGRCGELFNSPSEWHLHHRHWRVYGGGHVLSNLELLHANCHRQLHSQESGTECSCVPQGAFDEGLSCVSGN